MAEVDPKEVSGESRSPTEGSGKTPPDDGSRNAPDPGTAENRANPLDLSDEVWPKWREDPGG